MSAISYGVPVVSPCIRPLLLLLVVAVVGCGTQQSGDPQAASEHDPGPVHIHGLGVNPADGALFLATHTGLFRVTEQGSAVRIADRYQDTMAFRVVGPDHFLASGHPDGREDLPPFLGLIETRDAGESWVPISLQGEFDFHVLEIAGRTIYGFGSDFQSRKPQFLASSDRGRTWSELRTPGDIISLAVAPDDKRSLLAATDAALHISRDGGRHWRTVEGPPGLVAWPAPDQLLSVDGAGRVRRAAGGDAPWVAVGELGGAPAAFEPAGPDLYAALHDGTVKRSLDGGQTWETSFSTDR